MGRDLLFGSRIADAVVRAGVAFQRIDDPAALPPGQSVELVIVDWSDRQPGWGEALGAWAAEARSTGPPPRIVVFGPHTDLAAHVEVRAAGFGPMVARSRVLAILGEGLAGSNDQGR